MATAEHDIEYYLEAARELAGKVAATADRIDGDRQLPSSLAGEMADRGFFRLLLPRSLGGAQLDHPDFLRILEIFAAVDASTGWCLNQNNVFSTSSLRMPEQTAREIWAEERAVVTNGPPTATSQAVPVDGGYKLSGRWHFSSGSSHATWIAALAPISSGGPAQDASKDRTGARIMLMPKEAVTFLDFWQVKGLRGTASFSFEVEDLFIPSDHSYDPTNPLREDGSLYVIPTTLLFGSGFATVALGVARAALDTAIGVAGAKVPGRTSTLLQNQSTTQRTIGEAEAIWSSSKAFLRQSASSVWKGAQKANMRKNPDLTTALTTEERINLRLDATHAIRMAAQVVDLAYSLCGSDAIFETNPIQRQFQDIHVITQHAQGRLTHYDTAGQYFLGLDPEGNF